MTFRGRGFGYFVRELRKSKAMTQKRFAQYMGVSSLAVIKWESGQATPLKETVERLGEIANGYSKRKRPVQVLRLDRIIHVALVAKAKRS